MQSTYNSYRQSQHAHAKVRGPSHLSPLLLRQTSLSPLWRGHRHCLSCHQHGAVHGNHAVGELNSSESIMGCFFQPLKPLEGTMIHLDCKWPPQQVDAEGMRR